MLLRVSLQPSLCKAFNYTPVLEASKLQIFSNVITINKELKMSLPPPQGTASYKFIAILILQLLEKRSHVIEWISDGLPPEKILA